MASSLNDTRSRYVMGGKSYTQGNRIGWWERQIMPFRNDDTVFTITSRRYVGRADLIAYDYLGTEDLEWLVLQYNTILDPMLELQLGVNIRLPALSRLT